MLDATKYPNHIQIIRRARGLSQAYVAEQIGVSRPKYIEIEKGLKELTVSQLAKLGEILGVEKEDLLGIDTGRFDFRKLTESPVPPGIFIDLGVRVIWDDKNGEWLVPAREIIDYIDITELEDEDV